MWLGRMHKVNFAITLIQIRNSDFSLSFQILLPRLTGLGLVPKVSCIIKLLVPLLILTFQVSLLLPG